MLYLIGLGLSGTDSITLRGKSIIEKADAVFLEAYTSVLMGDECSVESLERLYSKKIVVADRQLVEEKADEILDPAVNGSVAFLVVGDSLCSTTHSDLILRAVERSIPWQVVPNASIVSAVAITGLQIYRFGEIISIPFWTDSWQPTSFVEKILSNFERDLHSLCLLDIKVGEVSVENLMRGRRHLKEPPRFMTVGVACQQLIDAFDLIATAAKEDDQDDKVRAELARRLAKSGLNADSLGIAVCRLGHDSATIATSTLREFASNPPDLDLGGPLHSLVIPGPSLHPIEAQMLTSAYQCRPIAAASIDKSLHASGHLNNGSTQ